jgi:hypothetical protein
MSIDKAASTQSAGGEHFGQIFRMRLVPPPKGPAGFQVRRRSAKPIARLLQTGFHKQGTVTSPQQHARLFLLQQASCVV